MQSVTLRMVFGGATANAQRASATSGRRPQFVSPSTEGVLVETYAHGTTTPVLGSSATDVSPGSAACGGSSSPTRTCSVIVGAPAGSDDFTVTTYNAKPATAGEGGTFAASANILGTGKSTQTIAPNVANTLTIYVSGVVATIGSASTFASLPADGHAHTFALVVNPQDFGNNPITAGTHDPYANPITVTLAEAGGSGHASLYLNGTNVGTTATIAKSTDSVTLHYDGGGAPGYGTSLTLSASGAAGSTTPPSQTVAVSPLYASSSSALYGSFSLAFTASGQSASLGLSELNAPTTLTYVASVGMTCGSTSSTVTGTGASATATITAGTTPVASCTLSIADSLGTVLSIPTSITTTSASIGVPGTITMVGGSSMPIAVVAGPDGNMWFTDDGNNAIGAYKPPFIWSYPIRTANAYPAAIIDGPDGNLWFTEHSSNGNIGKVTPAGAITEYALAPGRFPNGMAAGPDGNVWFTETSGNNIGRITPNGVITEFPLPASNSQPLDIAAGPDGNLWFTEVMGQRIGKITPAGVISEYGLAANTNPYGITAGPDGNVWFTEANGDKIGKITPSGTVTEYAGLTANAEPFYIAAGADGNLWFTERNAGKIGKITPSGVVTEYGNSSIYEPQGIAAGSDGKLWFTQPNTSQIGKIAP